MTKETEKLVGWFGSGGGGCSSESVTQWSEGKGRTKGPDVCGSFHGWCFCVNVGNVYAGGQQGQFGVGAGAG